VHVNGLQRLKSHSSLQREFHNPPPDRNNGSDESGLNVYGKYLANTKPIRLRNSFAAVKPPFINDLL